MSNIGASGHVLVSDMVEGHHPEYGVGLFATRDAIRSPSAEVQALRDALRDIALGATMMMQAPCPPALQRYAAEVRRVAEGNL